MGSMKSPLLISTSLPSWSKPPLGHYRQVSQSEAQRARPGWLSVKYWQYTTGKQPVNELKSFA